MPTRRAPLVLALALAVFGALAAAPRAARAQRGIDVETFRPAVDGFGLFSVERAETSRQFDFGFKLFIDYAHAPLRLAMKDSPGDAAPGWKTVMNFQGTAHIGVHLGLTDWMELALDIPASVQRYASIYGAPFVDSAMPGGAPAPTGFYAAEPRTNIDPPDASPLDPRVAIKLRTKRFGPLGLGLVLAATLPFGNEAAFLGDSNFTFRPNAIIDITAGRFTLALNAGAIVRQTTLVVDPVDVVAKSAAPWHLISVGTEVTGGLGVGVRAAKWLGIAAEGYALIPVTSDTGPAPATKDYVLDVLGGFQFFPGKDITISVGGGAGVLASRRHDLFRAFLGLSWTPSATAGGASVSGESGDRDGDGVPDALDGCPGEPEDKDGFEDEDGCPDPDNDGDDVPDAADRCPTELEDKDGFQDGDGCPDLDNDADAIPDAADRCPDEPEDKDGFDDDDGCPDPDNDGDGLPDGRDRCPNEPETPNGIDDDDGCPDSGGVVNARGAEGGPAPAATEAREPESPKKSAPRGGRKGRRRAGGE